jgi:hypothetical protein
MQHNPKGPLATTGAHQKAAHLKVLMRRLVVHPFKGPGKAIMFWGQIMGLKPRSDEDGKPTVKINPYPHYRTSLYG